MKSATVFAFVLLAFCCASTACAITIDMVPVGNVGNANDPITGNRWGGVGYAYSIGKYEVTVGQYTAFLNAVAATDTYSLYSSTERATDLSIAGVSRSGDPGSYSYSVIGSPNHPITNVSWGDAVRFANWLHNGQPIGAQTAATTEDGAYTLNGAISAAALNAVTRNANAKWVIPSENEWYKAAYYQSAAQGGDADNYWYYPMRSNSMPYSDQPPGATPDNTRMGNFYSDDGVANGYNDGYAVTGSASFSSSQNYLSDVGAYTSSTNFYGTFDQGGNVWEWTEALIDGAYRGLRGGAWGSGPDYMAAGSPGIAINTVDEGTDVGFRVISVPEPNTLLLGVLASLGMLARRRR